MTDYWEIASLNLVEVGLLHRPDKRGIKHILNIYFNETIQHYILGSCHLHIRRRENLKSHTRGVLNLM
jgi:hypothetical protein